MPEQLKTIIVIIPFLIMGLALATAVLFWLYDLVRPFIDNYEAWRASRTGDGVGNGGARTRGNSHADDDDDDAPRDRSIAGLARSVRAWFRTRFAARDDDADEHEDLDDATTALLAMLPNATVVVNKNDEVVRANPAAYMLGVVSDEAIADDGVREAVRLVRESGGRRQFDLTTHTAYSADQAAAEEANGDGRRPGDPVQVQGVTRPNWLKITVGKVGDFVVVLIDDVSDAIRFSQVRDSFITNVSEQLLKPSRALEQLADSLEDDTLEPEQVVWNAHRVRTSCNHLNRMVDDLLLLIKSQEPVVPSSANRLNVKDMLRSARDRLRGLAERSDVAVQIECDNLLTVNGDEEQVTAAITKLLENAIVYSPAGSSVSVSAGQAEDGHHALIRVIDQGVGIAKDEQARIFERFYRGRNQTDRSRDGIGLGLAIVKHVALAHHGGVTVWSQPGNGSTFTLSLPVAQ
ncbi:sensor histidine kinase [Bifidobacterium biavatii]|uniref:Sensor-like histidine kinase SenX3 n=1 Tax=Bifidobacterium biavatii DSM 23969 TaxID=1437608 RepID=A0A086ZXM2_9BIFI|nr:ATP-binding protein [Bifidobacterium biavatii]KFI51272.1 Sensor-like histidine kinase senX3 [Bifidobacterium biavatii DSM 23969]